MPSSESDLPNHSGLTNLFTGSPVMIHLVSTPSPVGVQPSPNFRFVVSSIKPFISIFTEPESAATDNTRSPWHNAIFFGTLISALSAISLSK